MKDERNNINKECLCNEDSNYQQPMPRLGERAPEFKAMTTNGLMNFPEDYKGKWVILFSHPADFTPVCTSEFMTFASRQEEFRELNCEIVGLSIDGLFSHIAWLRSIGNLQYNGIKNVTPKFPVIDDVSMNVARKYGMIQPKQGLTQAVRAVFFIDPEGILKAMIYYPLSLGRNFDEIKRVIVALKTTEEFKVSTPADWQPGMPVILGAPLTTAGAEERMIKKGDDCQDWYFCTRKLDEKTIMKKIKKNHE
ncbi:MAG: peroxiredoxin [Bacteroidetes bacterium]|nr:peroxiredoxin [Bacteroidota bacterium]